MRIVVGERTWNLSFPKYIGGRRPGRPRGVYGSCSRPDRTPRKILVRADLRGKRLVDTLIHELLHAGAWVLDEEVVEELATDIARVLYHKDVQARINGEV